MGCPLCLFKISLLLFKVCFFGRVLVTDRAAFACVVDNGNKGTRQKKHCSLPLITVQFSKICRERLSALTNSQYQSVMPIRRSLAHCKFMNFYSHLSFFRAESKENEQTILE